MRRFGLAVGATVAVTAIALLAWAYAIEPGRLVVHREALRISGLPPFRVVLLSDLHPGGNFIDRAKIERIVATAIAERPDLVVLLGDYVVTAAGRGFMSPEELGPLLAPLARHGPVYAVLGNHDWWFDGPRVRHALEGAGIRVLENEAVEWRGPAGSAWLVGLGDLMVGHADAKAALAGVPDGAPAIVLVHEPDVFPDLPARVPLTLAGHTHGGQVALPILGRLIVPSRFGQRYAAGHVEERGHHLFVTTGIGTSILPLRLGVPPEIAVLDVNR
jgi:predicted MPP superfamily phosphohydrolase